MPIVKMPDGHQVRFPDDMPREQIRDMIAKKFPDVAQPSYSGSILPFTKDESGVHFDSNAGIVGAIKDAFTLPHDVMAGDVNPTSDEGIGRAVNMAAMIGLDAGAPGAAAYMKKKTVKPPSTESLYSAGGDAFNRMRDTGVDYSSGAVKQLAEETASKLHQKGLGPTVAKKTNRVLKELANPPENSVAGITDLHGVRKTLGEIGQNFNKPSDQKAARAAIRKLDRFIGSPDPVAVVSGPAPRAGELLMEGNRNYAAAKRSDLLNGIERAADYRANGANSGRNKGNSIRQRIADVLTNDKKTSGFSPEEIKTLEGINKGSKTANATRYIGNLLGGGGGLGQVAATGLGLGAGSALGGSTGAGIGFLLPTALGVTSKTASNLLTERALKAADALVRKRSPLYEEMARNAPTVKIDPARKAAIIRALLLQQEAQQ